jgi:hypothetical protein
MKTKILILIFFLFSTPLFSEEPDKKLHEKCIYPTVSIVGKNERGDHYDCGTGFIVRSEKHNKKYYNVVISCAHITTGTKMKIKTPYYKDWSFFEGYRVYNCDVYASDPERDLSILLFVSDKQMPVIEWGWDQKYYIGSKMFKIGCSMGLEPRLDRGYINSINNLIRKKEGHFHSGTIRASVFTIPGDSGCANFVNYRLIGITQSITMNINENGLDQNYSITNIIPIEAFKKWNESLDNSVGFIYNNEEKLPAVYFKHMYFLGLKEKNPKTPKHFWKK